MSVVRLTLGGRPVVYLPADEPVPRPDTVGPDAEIVGVDLFEDRDLRRHPRLRRVLTTIIRPTRWFYGVLHWSDGSDLDVLDELVTSGDASEDLFAGAVLAEAATIACRNCDAHLRVLQVDPGGVLFGSSITERLRQHRFRQTCPACKEHLSLFIVEMLGIDAEDEP